MGTSLQSQKCNLHADDLVGSKHENSWEKWHGHHQRRTNYHDRHESRLEIWRAWSFLQQLHSYSHWRSHQRFMLTWVSGNHHHWRQWKRRIGRYMHSNQRFSKGRNISSGNREKSSKYWISLRKEPKLCISSRGKVKWKRKPFGGGALREKWQSSWSEPINWRVKNERNFWLLAQLRRDKKDYQLR